MKMTRKLTQGSMLDSAKRRETPSPIIRQVQFEDRADSASHRIMGKILSGVPSGIMGATHEAHLVAPVLDRAYSA